MSTALIAGLLFLSCWSVAAYAAVLLRRERARVTELEDLLRYAKHQLAYLSQQIGEHNASLAARERLERTRLAWLMKWGKA